MGWTLLNLQLTRVTASPFPGSERTGFWIAGFAGGATPQLVLRGFINNHVATSSTQCGSSVE